MRGRRTSPTPAASSSSRPGPAALHRIREGIAQAGIGISQAEITMIPRSGVAVSGSEAERLVRLLEALDGNDDVQKVSLERGVR